MRSTLLTRDESDDREAEHGFVVVWLAIVLVLLLSIAAFAVDLVNAYANAQRLQNAVDAAAMAGATQIPADLSGDAAKERVREIIRDNGFNPGELTLNEIDASNPNQMNVEMKHSFPTMFARVMGIATLTVRRVASGQYDAKVAMGSPANNLGDVPFEDPAGNSACADLQPAWSSGSPCATDSTNAKQSLFLQIQGRQTRKSAGNPYSSDFCHAAPNDGCGGNAGSGGPNLEYSADGQYYFVKNDVPGDPLVIAVYDAGFVHVGGGAGKYCNGKLTASAAGPTPKYDIVTGAPDPNWSDAQIAGTDPSRYYLNSPFCAGDTMQQGSGSCTGSAGQFACAQLLNTEFDVLAPDATPNDPTDNPVLSSGQCGAGGAPWNVGGQAVAYADPDTLTPPSPITATSTVSDGGGGTTTVPSRDFFQQYRVLCRLSSTDPTNSDYIVRVRAPNGSGSNNFSLLAVRDTTSALPAFGDINVFTKQRLPLFAQMATPYGVTPATRTGVFFVARVQPAARDRQLDIELFDLGDTPPPAASLQGTIKITLGTNTHIPGASPPDTFMNCSYTMPPGDDGYDPTAPWGPLSSSGPQCTFRYDRTTWNGQWVTLRVTIPGYNSGNGYTCPTGVSATPRDCWIKMEITPDAGVLSDATSWNAKLGGAPVRLVK